MGQSTSKSTMTGSPDYQIKPFLFSPQRAPMLVPTQEFMQRVRAQQAAKKDQTVQSNRFATTGSRDRMTELAGVRTNVDKPVKGPTHHVPHAGQHSAQYEAGKKY